MSELMTMPRLEGEGLVLRRFVEQDASLVVEAGKDPLLPLITTVPASGGREEAKAFIERQHRRLADGVGYSFCIARGGDDHRWGIRACGRIGRTRPGHGWLLGGAAFRGRDVATTALRLARAWGVAHPGVHRFELYVEPWNQGSWQAAQRAGFTRDGLIRRWEDVGDRVARHVHVLAAARGPDRLTDEY